MRFSDWINASHMTSSLTAPAATIKRRSIRQSAIRRLRHYQLRLSRSQAVPARLALGAAVGVFVAVLPIPGFQLASAVGLAWLIRAHRGAAIAATFAANPLTYPLIWLASYLLGAIILGMPVSEAAHDLERLSGFMNQGWPLGDEASRNFSHIMGPLTALTIGSIPLALTFAVIAYAGVSQLLKTQPARIPVTA